ncbi:MAG: hypothetical protein WB526_07635 [Candidatus Cybelea sp.]|jgi:erythromycin esterase-like protein
MFDERNEVSTMNATEARRARQAQGKRSMYDRLREDPQRAARIDRYLEELRLEQQFIDAMEQQHISAAELARRVNRKPASISRDLSGGLSTAKLGRVREMADAVGYDVVALLVPRDPVERKKAIGRVAKELVG